jgi:hypothetical protein
MKTNQKIPLLILLVIGLLLSISKVYSQNCISLVPFFGPPRYEAQMPAGYFFNVTTGSAVCPPSAVAGLATMPGMGINIIAPNAPQYMLDILCDPTVPTNMDVNISSAATLQNVGYRIGDSMIIWHNGILSSIFVGGRCRRVLPNTQRDRKYLFTKILLTFVVLK